MNNKDQAAIDYVASISKHHHAAMIVKWLITGWDVEVKIENDWKHEIYTSWSIGYEYRLIEPKPFKPAYRVYKNKRNEHTFTIDKIGGLVASKLPTDEDAVLIQDWIEYDPPKKWPTPLVERIAAIDIKAAEWIVDNWNDLLEERYTRKGMYDRESHLLSHSFDWSESDLDDNIWEEISTKLGE